MLELDVSEVSGDFPSQRRSWIGKLMLAGDTAMALELTRQFLGQTRTDGDPPAWARQSLIDDLSKIGRIISIHYHEISLIESLCRRGLIAEGKKAIAFHLAGTFLADRLRREGFSAWAESFASGHYEGLAAWIPEHLLDECKQ